MWFSEAWEPNADIIRAAETHDVELRAVAVRGIERIASTSSPQPVVAEVELPAITSGAGGLDVLTAANAVLALIDINDPGNVGTLMRSAEAAGFEAIVVAGQSTDPFGPKSVRASAGAVLRVPVIDAGESHDALRLLGDAGLERLGTRMHDAEPCDTADLTQRAAVVLGSEAHGLSADLGVEGIDRWIAIPMAGSIESLNVAMAGTILTYEIGRQHRSAQM